MDRRRNMPQFYPSRGKIEPTRGVLPDRYDVGIFLALDRYDPTDPDDNQASLVITTIVITWMAHGLIQKAMPAAAMSKTRVWSAQMSRPPPHARSNHGPRVCVGQGV